MAEIVNSLFGLSPTQIRQQQDVEAQAFGNQIASTFADPWERQQAAQGAMIGNALVKLGGKLFGLETPELKRATGLETILQQTTQEVGSQDPAVLYPVLAKRLSAAGFTREALQVGAVGDKAKREAMKEASEMMYKDSMTKYNGLLAANQEAALESKKLEQQGQVAYGALQAYKGIADPVGKTRVWETTLNALEKKGVDVSVLRDIPWEQREATLNSIVESSDTAATRVKAEIAQMNNNIKISQEQGKNDRAAEVNSLRAAIENSRAEMRKYAVDSAERRALENKVDSFSNQLKLLDIRQKDDTNANAAASTKLKEWNNQTYSYLENDLGLDSKSAESAITFFNTTYQELLGEKRDDGYPKYTPATALNETKIRTEAALTQEDKKVFGIKTGGTKPKFSGKATAPAQAEKPATTKDKFVNGKIYTDANGNKAKYNNGKWEAVP